jgi:CHAT domain-containing protein
VLPRPHRRYPRLRVSGPHHAADGRRGARHAGRAPSTPGPTVVFGACDTDVAWADFDESLTLATAFLAAGAAAVVGARWAVLDRHTAVAMFALHHFRTARGEPAADALRSAQLWMLDPRREPLPGMPADLARWARRPVVADLSVWAAFGHHGR